MNNTFWLVCSLYLTAAFAAGVWFGGWGTAAVLAVAYFDLVATVATGVINFYKIIK